MTTAKTTENLNPRAWGLWAAGGLAFTSMTLFLMRGVQLEFLDRVTSGAYGHFSTGQNQARLAHGLEQVWRIGLLRLLPLWFFLRWAPPTSGDRELRLALRGTRCAALAAWFLAVAATVWAVDQPPGLLDRPSLLLGLIADGAWLLAASIGVYAWYLARPASDKGWTQGSA